MEIGRERFSTRKRQENTAKERTQGPFEETVRLMTQGLFEEHSQGKDTKTFEGRGHKAKKWRVQKNGSKRGGGRGRKRKEKRSRRRTEKKEMVKKVQRDHHMSFTTRRKKGEKEKESRKRARRPKAMQTLGKFEKWLPLIATGAELPKCQCCSSKTTKKNGSGDENATRSADQRSENATRR